jgi:hypothetical protein|tara:strand:- start:3201 stop:3590 length:390 start_codon:yes stop_codon:yes gene_type:complete
MTTWYKKAQDAAMADPAMADPAMAGAGAGVASGELGEPEDSIQDTIKEANKLLKRFMTEDKEDSKDALMRVSRALGSKYSPRLWIVDYTKNPPEIVDYDGVPLSDYDQQAMAEEKGGDSGGGGGGGLPI